MRENTAGIWFDRNTRVHDAPRFPEPLRSFFANETATVNGIKSPRTVESVRIGRKPPRRKQGGGHAVFGGAPNMERLCHRAKVAANPGRQAGRDAETAAQSVAC